jgi:predicted anti-sigma-YlaC factor YlaD
MSTPHVDVAAYVLGILDEPDDAAFTQHFARCPRCRAEFRELSDLPRLLDQLKPEDEEPAEPVAAPPGRQRRPMLWLAAAAAVALLVTVPIVVWQSGGEPTTVAGPTVTVTAPRAAEPSTTSPKGSTPSTPTVAGARTMSGSNPDNGVSASITVQPESWGTSVTMELRGITGPLQCRLTAVSKTGDAQVVTSWWVPTTGFGVPGVSEPLWVQGGVGIEDEDIERFVVSPAEGPDLLWVPAAA